MSEIATAVSRSTSPEAASSDLMEKLSPRAQGETFHWEFDGRAAALPTTSGSGWIRFQSPSLLGRWIRRAINFGLGSIALISLLPLMLLIAAAIRLESEGPALFWQRRIGHRGRVFEICKFRTMRVSATDPSGGAQACRNDNRFTMVGRFLRRSSLDELPQLINVLRGEMALVGPRPHAVDHHNYYTKNISAYSIRLMVKPGITGWAQVNGWRGETRELEAMIERVNFDLDYISRMSILFDLQIMLYTITWYRKHSCKAY